MTKYLPQVYYAERRMRICPAAILTANARLDFIIKRASPFAEMCGEGSFLFIENLLKRECTNLLVRFSSRVMC